MKVCSDDMFNPLFRSVELESLVAAPKPNEFAWQDNCARRRVIHEVVVVVFLGHGVLCRYGVVAIPRRSSREHTAVLCVLCRVGRVIRIRHVIRSIEEVEYDDTVRLVSFDDAYTGRYTRPLLPL